MEAFIMKCIIHVTTVSNINNAIKALKTYQQYAPDHERKLIVIDQFEDDKAIDDIINDCEIKYAYEIFGTGFYKNAFTFTQEEFTDYIALLSVKYYFDQGYSSILLTNGTIEFTSDISQLEQYSESIHNSIWFLHESIDQKLLNPSQMINDFSKQPLLSESKKNTLISTLFFNQGNTVTNFINWCIRQYEFIYFRSCGHYLTTDNTRNDGKLLTMQSILLQNAMLLDIYHPIYEWKNVIHIKENRNESYRFDYFTDGTPINNLIRDIFSTTYIPLDRISSNPFINKKILVEDSIIYENDKNIPATSAMIRIYNRRIDLRNVFSSFPHDRRPFAKWFVENAKEEFDLDEAYIEPVRKALDEFTVETSSLTERIKNRLFNNSNIPDKYPFGVNLCGYIRGNFGLSEATRQLARNLQAANIPFTIISYTASAYHSKVDNHDWDTYISNEFKYNINIMLNGASNASFFSKVTASEAYRDRYNIGYWFWELPEFYEDWTSEFDYVDEVWAATKFNKDAYEARTNKPVKVMPLSMSVPVDESCTREYFGLPEDKFIFLVTYDVRSVSTRKNPQAAVKAFINEFKEDEKAMLVIKMSAPKDWNGEDDLINSVKDQSNVKIINQTFSKPVINALINCCDVYVSLHRSEGLGLGPAEAMYLGKPVIMTGWSGNMEYANNDNSCLVDYDIIELKENIPPYRKGSHWADANIEDASRYMRKLYEDKNYYDLISHNGYKTMHEDYDAITLGKKMKDRLEEVQKHITDTVYNNLLHVNNNH